MSERDQILRKLKSHKKIFESYGIKDVILFGSAARNEPIIHDIDLCVFFDKPPARGLAMLGIVDELKENISESLKKPVDIVIHPVRKDRLRDHIEKEGIHAF